MDRNPSYGSYDSFNDDSMSYEVENNSFENSVVSNNLSARGSPLQSTIPIEENNLSTSVAVNEVCRMIPIMWSSNLTYDGVLAMREINQHFKKIEKEKTADKNKHSVSSFG